MCLSELRIGIIVVKPLSDEITLSLLLLLLLKEPATAQNTDTVINTGIYKSYFSYKVKEPLYVTYALEKGGGTCDRKTEHFSFKDEDDAMFAKGSDYKGSLYDKGHLANAEDFASDCDEEELTFKYYNCLPQTRKLNRGIWKSWEVKVRKMSEKKKLFVIAGGIYSSSTLGKRGIGVPDSCYKIVLDVKTKKTLLCLIFANNNSNTAQPITLAKLKTRLKYGLVP